MVVNYNKNVITCRRLWKNCQKGKKGGGDKIIQLQKGKMIQE